MTGEPVDVRQLQAAAIENAGDGGRDIRLGERRNGSVKYDSEAVGIDIPAHDVERIRPIVLTTHLDGGDAIFSGSQDASGGAVAEQRGRHDVRLGQLVEPESQGADFNR